MFHQEASVETIKFIVYLGEPTSPKLTHMADDAKAKHVSQFLED